MSFAGKELLERSAIRLMHGRRYALVRQTGNCPFFIRHFFVLVADTGT